MKPNDLTYTKGTSRMPYTPTIIANNILQRAFRDRVPVTPMKLQRILWFTAAEYAKTSGDPLLAEQFEPWPYGPVVRSVNAKFAPFAGTCINKYSKDAAGLAHTVNEKEAPTLAAVLDTVWDAAKDLSPVTLARITHLPGSAWCETTARRQMRIDHDALVADTSYRVMLGL